MSSISTEDMSSLSSSQVFVLDTPSRINSMDFFHNGEHLVVANDEGTILLCDALEGRIINKLFAKKYGINNVCWTHHSTAIVGSSTLNKYDSSIRYLSIHDNTYLREYRGHTDFVNCIAVSPVDDTMLSTSWDNTIRQWDLRSPYCVGLMKNPGFSYRVRHHVAIDRDGIIFGISTGAQCVKLFDLKNPTKGPFSTFLIEQNNDSITSIVFTDDGKFIAVGTEGPAIYLIDAFDGKVIYIFNVKNAHRCVLGVSFTPDSKYLLGGSDDGTIIVWSLDPNDSYKQVATLEGHAGPVSCVKWNPLYLECASACSNVVFWEPSNPGMNMLNF